MFVIHKFLGTVLIPFALMCVVIIPPGLFAGNLGLLDWIDPFLPAILSFSIGLWIWFSWSKFLLRRLRARLAGKNLSFFTDEQLEKIVSAVGYLNISHLDLESLCALPLSDEELVERIVGLLKG